MSVNINGTENEKYKFDSILLEETTQNDLFIACKGYNIIDKCVEG